MIATTDDARFWDRAARKYARDPIKDMAGYERTVERTKELLAPRILRSPVIRFAEYKQDRRVNVFHKCNSGAVSVILRVFERRSHRRPSNGRSAMSHVPAGAPRRNSIAPARVSLPDSPGRVMSA